MFQCAPGPCSFSREDVLRRVAQFIVCDDQSLAVADKAAFRNCLVAMQPNATKADIPSTHDVSTFVHNEFINFIKQLKVEIQLPSTGRISTTMDLWSVEQTKAAFLGITGTGSRSMPAQSGHYACKSLPFHCYFISLSERAGIISSVSTKLLCLTADNATSNDKAADLTECLLHRRNIYSFSSDSPCLPCLTHIINLTITSVLAAITKISNVNTVTTIWEFDPTLPENRMDDLLDVVTAIHTLAVKIQCSGQRIEYFETLQTKLWY
ncbi:hypothetical protein JVU11DRAFT_9102 [Chiua virens]|nr:hypothetical protein JVU11DRAFT_9102 [Chiua virens]